MSGLPHSWVDVKLGHVFSSLSNGIADKQNVAHIGIPVTRIETISTGKVDPARIGYVEPLNLEKVNRYRLKPNDILFSHINSPAHLGKTALYLGEPSPLYHGTNLLLIRCADAIIDARYLEYGLRYLRTKGIFELNAQKAVNQASINQKMLSALKIPLAPRNEQVRIANKLDASLQLINGARKRLSVVPQILKKFREAVLEAAVSGRLTEEWRERHGEDIAAWQRLRATQVFSFVTSGSRGWAKYYSINGALFLRIGNLDHNTIDLDLSDRQYVKPPKGSEGERTRVRMGDILISITADVGMIGLVRTDPGEAYINQHICLARPARGHNSAFLSYFLVSPISGLAQLTALQRGATKVGLTLGDIRGLEFVLPSPDEQSEIVRRVECLLASAVMLENRYQTIASLIHRLTPSVLSKAFRGELVPQDPNDEPAEVMLDRLRTTRALENGQRKTALNDHASKNPRRAAGT